MNGYIGYSGIYSGLNRGVSFYNFSDKIFYVKNIFVSVDGQTESIGTIECRRVFKRRKAGRRIRVIRLTDDTPEWKNVRWEEAAIYRMKDSITFRRSMVVAENVKEKAEVWESQIGAQVWVSDDNNQRLIIRKNEGILVFLTTPIYKSRTKVYIEIREVE